MKRLTVLFVLACLCGSLFAGGKRDSAGSAGSSSSTNRYAKRLNISLANVGVLEGYNFTSGDGFVKYYSEKFNYNLDVAALGYDNWSERLRVWISSGDMPDVAVINYNHPDFASYIEQGLLKKFPANWKTRWPNVAKANSVSTLGPKMEEVFGGTYFIPRPRFNANLPGDPLPDHLSLYMRKDWAEAVGFPVKSTYKVSEVMEFIRLVKERDPGKLGSRLIPLVGNPAYATRLFVGSNSTHYNGFYKDSDGKYKWGAAAPETLLGLKQFSEAYNKGWLNPEFYTTRIDADIDQLTIQGIAGACFQPAPTGDLYRHIDNYAKNHNVDGSAYINAATVLGEDGYYHQEDLINFWGVIGFNPNIDEEKFERWMDVMEYNCTPEGYATIILGIKDVDWSIDSSGAEYRSLLPPGQSLGGANGKYPGIGSTLGMVVLPDDFAFQNPNIPRNMRDLSKKLYAERCQIATPQSFSKVDWNIYCYDSPSRRRASFDYGREFSGLVTMKGDIEENWKAWVQSKMPMVQPVLDELNSLR
jgi:putative aldouronate transport system substrate-binding protein